MRPGQVVEKAWGGEYIFATNELYSGKVLYFKKDAYTSMHFHDRLDKTWLVLQGEFKVKTINTEDASVTITDLKEGDSWRCTPLTPNQLTCVEEGVIVEVSSKEEQGDIYRILPGNSQML